MPTLGKIFYSFKITLFFLFAAIAYKLWLVEAIPVSASSLARHDGLLFQQLAISVINGNWLGEYNHLTLTKGAGYPLWIALIWTLSIPLKLANELLYISSVLIFFRLLLLLKVNNLIAIFGVLLLLFNPATLNNSYWGGFIRQSIYFSFCSISIFSILIYFYYVTYLHTFRFRWVLLSGITLGCAWITREETIWMVPVFLWITLFALFVCDKGLKNRIRQFTIFIIPFLISFSIVSTVSYVNFNYYKYHGITEFNSQEFKDAWNAVVGANGNSWKQYWPLRMDTLEKIYKYSDSARELEPYLQTTNKKNILFKNTDLKTYGWLGTIAHWQFRSAVRKAGYYQTDILATNDFYKRLTQEINDACEKGQLTCRDNLFGMVHWDSSYTAQIPSRAIEVVTRLTTFFKYYATKKFNSINGDTKYINIIGSLSHGGMAHPTTQQSSDLYPEFQKNKLTHKVNALEKIINQYRHFSYKLFLFSVFVLLYYIIRVNDLKEIKVTIVLVASSMLVSISVIISLNTLLAITAYPTYTRVLMTATPYYIATISLLFVVIPRLFVGKRFDSPKVTHV